LAECKIIKKCPNCGQNTYEKILWIVWDCKNCGYYQYMSQKEKIALGDV